MGWLLRAFVIGCLAGVSTSCVGVRTDLAPHRDGVPYYLPRTLIELTFTPGERPAIAAVPVEIADLSQRYVTSYAANGFADDRICIVRTKTGLLTKVYFSADDRSDDFLLDIVQLAGEAGGGGGAAESLSELDTGPTAPVVMLIDPYDPQQIAEFNKRISPFRIEFPSLPIPVNDFVCPNDSVCFATKATVPIQVKHGTEFITQSSVEMVDAAIHGSLNLKREFMTDRVTKLDFDMGVLTSLRVRKDSEALAVAEFPLKAIERLLAVPGNAVAVAFGSYADKKAYANRRKDLGSIPPTPGPVVLIDTDTCLAK